MQVDVDAIAAELDARLAETDAQLAARYPGERAGRQPVHTVYVPADRYHAELCPDWGAQALDALNAHAQLFRDLLAGADADGTEVADEQIERVRRKLASEPIEDLRIDFEDGYGPRTDDVEDTDVQRAAAALAASAQGGSAPPFTGIRFKSFEAPTRRRGLRTLASFVSALCAADGQLDGFVVTLPKVTSVEQVHAMVLRVRRDRDRARTRHRHTALRDPGGDAAVDPRTGRHRLGRPDGARVVRPLLRRCTTAPTTTRPSAASPPSTRAWRTRSPTTPSW